MAEALALKMGLGLSSECCFRKVVVETDSLSLTSAFGTRLEGRNKGVFVLLFMLVEMPIGIHTC